MSDEPQRDPPCVYNATSFRGRVYGVTGSAHGIGEETVRQLSALGASVVVIDINQWNLKRVESDLQASNASALCICGDVADERVIKQAIRTAHKRWGRIDGWVNNACYNRNGQPDTMPLKELTRAWKVNTENAWISAGLLTPIMTETGGGSIVNLSSILAHLALPGNTAYAMAKAALEGFTRGLAADLGPHRIRVNAVVPGSINTHREAVLFRPQPPSVPSWALPRSLALRDRMDEAVWRVKQPWPEEGRPHHVAAAILFLLSDASRFITGVSLPVDGGSGTFSFHLQANPTAELERLRKQLGRLTRKYPTLRMRYLLRIPNRKRKSPKTK